MKCWICENEANSEEHKFKASIIKRYYGKDFKKKPLVFFEGNERHQVETYKSDVFKFRKVICINCNNNVTREHDNAYDEFCVYCQDNYLRLLNEQVIDYKLIYGDNWITKKQSLHRYFAKHAGCKIATSQHHRFFDLPDFIRELSISECFTIRFLLNVPTHSYVSYLRENFPDDKYVHLYNGATTTFLLDSDMINFAGWTSFQWITAIWVVSNHINANKRINYHAQRDTLMIKGFEDVKSFSGLSRFEELIPHIEEIHDPIKFYKELIL